MSLEDMENGELIEQPVQEVITKDGDVVPPVDAKMEHDHNVVRKNIHQLLVDGMESLKDVLLIAQSSEEHKDWEQYANLYEKIANTNLKLLEADEKYNKLLPKKASEDNAKSVTNNNAIFVGTSEELDELINNITKGNDNATSN